MKKFLGIVLALAMLVAMPVFAMADDAAPAEDAADVKSEGVMTYEEYMAAELDSQVVVEAYVQAKQSWWEDKATVYAQDKDGHAAEFDKAGKVIYLSAADIDSILTLQCDVSN